MSDNGKMPEQENEAPKSSGRGTQAGGTIAGRSPTVGPGVAGNLSGDGGDASPGAAADRKKAEQNR
jgi:hypothetical protein